MLFLNKVVKNKYLIYDTSVEKESLYTADDVQDLFDLGVTVNGLDSDFNITDWREGNRTKRKSLGGIDISGHDISATAPVKARLRLSEYMDTLYLASQPINCNLTGSVLIFDDTLSYDDENDYETLSTGLVHLLNDRVSFDFTALSDSNAERLYGIIAKTQGIFNFTMLQSLFIDNEERFYKCLGVCIALYPLCSPHKANNPLVMTDAVLTEIRKHRDFIRKTLSSVLDNLFRVLKREPIEAFNKAIALQYNADYNDDVRILLGTYCRDFVKITPLERLLHYIYYVEDGEGDIYGRLVKLVRKKLR